MDLAELQRAFQRHIIDGDDAIADEINQSGRVSAATRLGVYADAYRLRLADALAANFPRLQQLLGADAFSELAGNYLRQHPSANPSVRWFGDRLADWLRAQQPDQPVLAELAQWEWLIAAAFDAPDTPPLTEQDLTRIDPAAWAMLQFELHPSAQLLSLHTNAPALFKALSNNATPPAPESLASAQHWLIWRQELTPRYRSIAADETRLLQIVAGRATFEQLCEALCEWHAVADVPARAALLLKSWVNDEFLVRVSAG